MTSAPVAWKQAQAALASQDLPGAKRFLEATLRSAPSHTMARVLLAGVFLSDGKLREACTHLVTAAQSVPDDPAVICRVTQALMRVGESATAKTCLAHPAIGTCQDAPALVALAHVHQMLGEHSESLALMDRARACGFDSADFRYFRAIQLQFNGRLEEAEHELETCLRMGPTYGRASLTLSRLRKQTPNAHHLAYIRNQLTRVSQGTEDHAGFEFALYKELEDLGDIDAAWAALQRANRIMHARLRHDSDHEKRLYESLMSICDSRFLDPTNVDHDGPTPIFVIGMPRSGTTVLDRILGNHSQIFPVGELSDFAHQLRYQTDVPGRTLIDETLLSRLRSIDFKALGQRYLMQTRWRLPSTRFFVDKLPANFMVAGLIAKALPQAIILHVSRSPMDVCFSNYRALFGDAYAYSYHLDTLAAHHRLYKRLMAHWHDAMPGRILDVDYQTLVTDPESETRKVLQFCSLAYEQDCTDLSRNTAPSATLSSVQVRERIHSRGIGEWRRYERHLQPFAEALAR